MNSEEMKKWIDDASYEQLLSRWRSAPVGDPMFIGGVGSYYKEKMAEKQSQIGDEEAVRASKRIGWRE